MYLILDMFFFPHSLFRFYEIFKYTSLNALNILEREQVQYSFLNTKTFETKKLEGAVSAQRVQGLDSFLWQ